MAKTLEEWIVLYNRKTGEQFERDKRFAFFYSPDKGFCEITDTGKILVAGQTCGKIKFWRNFVERLSRKLNYTVAGANTGRHIKPYIRCAGFSPCKIEKTPEGDRYFCKDKNTGQKGMATPVGDKNYYITWEVIPLGTLF